jgi:hypothetical protein
MSVESNGNVVVIKEVANVTRQEKVSIEIEGDVKNDVKSDEKNIVKRHDFLFKLILLGDTQTGKTNLLSR